MIITKGVVRTLSPPVFPKIRFGFEIRRKSPAHVEDRDSCFHWFVKVETWAAPEAAAIKHGRPLLKSLKPHRYWQ